MALGINKVSIKTITFSSCVIWVGFYAWRIIFNNFAVEYFDASPTDVGLIQSAREIPGLLAFGVGALAVYFTESKIASFSIVLIGIGLIVSGWSPSLFVLGFATVLMSFGFHYFEPANGSQLLMLAENSNAGKMQGKLRSFESLAGLIGGLMVLGLTLFLDYRQTMYLIGAFVTAVGLYLYIALPSNRGKTENRKVTIKKDYWLYYTLAFLRGCRRHIFTTFAIFLLVKDHHLSITMVTVIMLANSFITIFTHRWFGYISDKLGERILLAGSSFILTFIFFGYAYVSYLPLLIAMFLIDNVMFGSSIALKSYIRKISDPSDLTGCLSFGMTANHITAVVIPIVGGIMWEMFGFRTTFIAGAIIVFIDMLFALKVPKKSVLDN
ncbi:MAG: MFS transporter [Candidatus Zixiibacteriota bacterium]